MAIQKATSIGQFMTIIAPREKWTKVTYEVRSLQCEHTGRARILFLALIWNSFYYLNKITYKVNEKD